MKPRRQRLTQEQRIALLEDCVTSSLTVREYAALKNVGYSTLNGWAAQAGFSLISKKKIFSGHQEQTSLADETPLSSHADFNDKKSQIFSFIDMTNYTKDAAPPFLSSAIPRPAQESPCTKDLPPSCGLEIRMPNGVMLKVDQVPFPALWLQITELVRAVAP